MGTDKAHLRLGGQSFVEKINGELSTFTQRVSVVSSKPDACAWGLPVVMDAHRGVGALGGLHAALAHAAAPWSVVVSCDLPFVTTDLFRHLASCVGEAFDAVAPLQEDGRVQPLCAIYRTRECRREIEKLLQEDELRPRELLARVRTRFVNFDELSSLDGAENFFLNINTPEEYERARITTTVLKT